MKNILFATDGSDSAQAAAEQVKQLLTAFPAATVHVLYVVKPAPMVDGLGMGLTPTPIEDAEDALAADIEAVTREEFQAFASRMNFTTIHGYPAPTICEFAQNIDADLIVVGSHGRGAFDRMLLGSVSNGVVHRAHVPVLVVK